jgi:mRNA interferase YafQ
MLKPSTTSQFKKDFKKCQKSSQRDILALKELMQQLSEQAPLADRYRDHPLSGNFVNHRECHIKPDWLLIYYIDAEKGEITFVRTGSHSELFK